MTVLGPLASMTGFGRATGATGDAEILVEIRSVNARGLDLRMRTPPGFDWMEGEVRKAVGEAVHRGAVQVQLSVARAGAEGEIVVNAHALDTVLAAMEEISRRTRTRKPSPEAVLGLKGVLETRETTLSSKAEEALHQAVRETLGQALASLLAARQQEGERLGKALADRIDEIARLTAAAEIHPSRTREAIMARLRAQLEQLGEAGVPLPEERLAQEALILATKADIREELDRLTAHVAAARALLAEGGPVGRKLDFLSQEFNREANTLCSKSNDVGLTGIGLDLKATIDQLREQVQNLQ